MQDNKVKNCKICGKEFFPRSGRQIYCSDECYLNTKRQLNRELYRKRQKSKTEHKSKTKLNLEELHDLRIQQQKEASAMGVTYGQYIAWLQAGLIGSKREEVEEWK